MLTLSAQDRHQTGLAGLFVQDFFLHVAGDGVHHLAGLVIVDHNVQPRIVGVHFFAADGVVEQGAWTLAKTFRMPALAGYLRQSAGEVLPRLQVALEHDSLEGIFVTC